MVQWVACISIPVLFVSFFSVFCHEALECENGRSFFAKETTFFGGPISRPLYNGERVGLP